MHEIAKDLKRRHSLAKLGHVHALHPAVVISEKNGVRQPPHFVKGFVDVVFVHIHKLGTHLESAVLSCVELLLKIPHHSPLSMTVLLRENLTRNNTVTTHDRGVRHGMAASVHVHDNLIRRVADEAI